MYVMRENLLLEVDSGGQHSSFFTETASRRREQQL